MANSYSNVVPQAISTNMNSAYFRSNFIPYKTITIDNKPVQVLDILSPAYLQILRNLQPLGFYTFVTGQQLPSTAYAYTNTTSTWWLFTVLNGYFHPLQMQEGDTVFIPNTQAAINSNSTQLTAPSPSTVVF